MGLFKLFVDLKDVHISRPKEDLVCKVKLLLCN